MADVTLDFQFTSLVKQVWKALTDSNMLEKWIWENDFKPVIGEKFQFRSEDLDKISNLENNCENYISGTEVNGW